MTETGRIVLTAALLSGIGLGAFAWRVMRTDPDVPERLIGQLRLAQFAAIALAAAAAIPIGLAIGGTPGGAIHLDAAIGVAFLLAAGYVLLREPRDALGIASASFVLHALVTLAHRPGWLQPGLAPRWYLVGCAVYDVYLAGLCYLARRRP